MENVLCLKDITFLIEHVFSTAYKFSERSVVNLLKFVTNWITTCSNFLLVCPLVKKMVVQNETAYKSISDIICFERLEITHICAGLRESYTFNIRR